MADEDEDEDRATPAETLAAQLVAVAWGVVLAILTALWEGVRRAFGLAPPQGDPPERIDEE